MVDTIKERILQELEIMLINIYKYPVTRMETNVPINSSDTYMEINLLVNDGDYNPLIIFKILEVNEGTDIAKNQFIDLFNSIKSLKICMHL